MSSDNPGSPNIMLVDADHDSRFFLARLIYKTFPAATVLQASTLEAAIQLLTQNRIDVAVTHRGRGADGAHVVRAIRKAMPSLEILMISSADRAKEAAAAGASRFVSLGEPDLISAELIRIIGSAFKG